MSHITGGGIPGNVPRVLPEGLGLRIEVRWARASIFDLIERAGSVDELEMRRTFNVGIGFVIVVPPSDAETAIDTLRRTGHDAFRMGTVVTVGPDRAFEDRVEWPG